MPDCPKYRLRLFLSVDLVGSTAFKARFAEKREKNEPNPYWVTQIRHFYREFPEFLARRFEKALNLRDEDDHYKEHCPTAWKTVGDEILFCVRLISHEHLSHCVSAFLGALEDYGYYLDTAGKHLDVKGAGWVAAFPAPNVTVEVIGQPSAGDLSMAHIDEGFEARADQSPSEFDFLGKEIDCGFRVAKYASSDRFVASIELAWLLTESARHDIFRAKFAYHGRQSMKGVISDRPYPIVTIDAERSTLRREVQTREKALNKTVDAEPLLLRDFLKSFMDDEGIELPILTRHTEIDSVVEMPQSYKLFEAEWSATAKENEERVASEEASVGASDGTQGDLPVEIGDAFKRFLSKIEDKPAAE